MGVQFPLSVVMREGEPYVHLMSIGPDDESHSGLPAVQSNKLKDALAAGICLIRGAAWLGLPRPVEIRDPMVFVQSKDSEREQRQIDALAVLKLGASASLRSTQLAVGPRHGARLVMKRCSAKPVLNGLMGSWWPAISLIRTIFCVPTIRRAQREPQFSIRQIERGSKQSSGFDLRP